MTISKETPRTDEFNCGLYNSAMAEAAGMSWGREYSPEESYGMALDFARTLERELSVERLKRQQVEHERDSILEALAGSQREQAVLREALQEFRDEIVKAIGDREQPPEEQGRG